MKKVALIYPRTRDISRDISVLEDFICGMCGSSNTECVDISKPYPINDDSVESPLLYGIERYQNIKGSDLVIVVCTDSESRYNRMPTVSPGMEYQMNFSTEVAYELAIAYEFEKPIFFWCTSSYKGE